MRITTLFFCLIIVLAQLKGFAQSDASVSSEIEVSRLLQVLASDSLKGRGNYTPEIAKTAAFIATEFEQYGLQVLPPHYTYWQPFSANSNLTRDVLTWNQNTLKDGMYRYFSPQLIPDDKKLSDFEVVEINTPIDSLLYRYWHYEKDVLLWYKTTGKGLPKNVLVPAEPLSHNVLLVAHPLPPDSLLLRVNTDYSNKALFNVAGVLPGKTRPGEFIIFSAHYDHLGSTGKTKGDAVYNGANDNASGTAAMLALAHYYAKRKDNERTLVFCAFAGEELGLLGSRNFAGKLAPKSIKAVINIEMIGRAQYGKNNFFITGAYRSSFGKLFRENVKNRNIKIVDEPSDEKDLFRRSDNFPFAEAGIPAHTIMSSDDDDACYHKECDETERLDVNHMTSVIHAIIQGCQPIISGQQTPSRIRY